MGSAEDGVKCCTLLKLQPNFVALAENPYTKRASIKKYYLQWFCSIVRLGEEVENLPLAEMLSLTRKWPMTARAYPGFCSIKRLGILLFLLDGMLVHRR